MNGENKGVNESPDFTVKLIKIEIEELEVPNVRFSKIFSMFLYFFSFLYQDEFVSYMNMYPNEGIQVNVLFDISEYFKNFDNDWTNVR